jgi:ATP-dependent helicase HepA
MNTINNSLYGFKELAGCKIILKPHQIKTIMRCLKNENCRYMIADEVGLGKTIEAISVLKVFLIDKHNQHVLITVPDALLEQWKTELAFKFKLFEGENYNSNYIDLIPISKLSEQKKYDFIIVDEVHRYLMDSSIYNKILVLSKNAKNIIMLSATPLQKRNEEYKKLLTLIQPNKYSMISNDDFNNLLECQSKIVRKIFNALDEFDALNESIDDNDSVRSDEIEENFESTFSELEGLKRIINDNYYDSLLKKIDYASNDFGVEAIQNCIAYVCENYQLEKSIIRNRRKKIELYENSNVRELIDLSYDVENEFNNEELNAFRSFSDWIENNGSRFDFKKDIIPVINSLFSSAAAYKKQLSLLNNKYKIEESVIEYAENYKRAETMKAKKILEYLDDPEQYSSKLVNVTDFIDQECEGKKVLLFTSFPETFELYKNVFNDVFGEDRCAYFNKEMDSDNLELNVYRFQNDNKCILLLSDETGGEGRNFQNADYLIHLDIPWSANDLEQRIGRLDRIGRDSSKPVVSIVSYSKGTTEESLFKLWNDGLDIFHKSQSGLEIIMNDIDDQILLSLKDSFKYGLEMAKKELDLIIKNQLDALKKEQLFDIASYQYQNLNKILDNTIEKFNASETDLFGQAMMGWAALSGFNAASESKDVIVFSPYSMSFQSLSNTMLIPPDMKALIDDKLNQMRNRIRSLSNEKIKQNNNLYIRGTFNRKLALSNDYLNFFAPGDDIFNCITNNALDSYKGTCSAFATKGRIKWTGFIFTWKIQIDEKIIYDSKLPSHIIDQYRGYIPLNQIVSTYSISGDEDETKVINEFNRIINENLGNKSAIVHLGKRSGGYLEKFKQTYSQEKWKNLVEEAYKVAYESAFNKCLIARTKLLKALNNELTSLLSAEKAISKYYNVDDLSNKVKEENDAIYNSVKKATVVLDSACFVVINNE